PFSDVAGRYAVRIDDSTAKRKDLAQRLANAGCPVNVAGNDWLSAGDFTPPPPPGGGLVLGKRLPSTRNPSCVRLDAKFHYRRRGQGQLEIINHGPEAVYDLDLEFPDGLQGFHIVDTGTPVQRLPAGKSFTIPCILTLPRNFSRFDLTIIGRAASG